MNDTSETSAKIIVYTDSEGIGGAEISLGHLVATTSMNATVIGVSETVIDFIAKDRPKFILQKNFFSHWQTFNRLQPNVIHINLCTPWAGAIALSAALIIPTARVIRVDQLPLRTTDAIELWRTRFLSLRVDAHVAVGKASAQRMEDFYALGRNSVISVPNGVPDLGEPESSIKETMTVGGIGRLDAMKAHEILLKAIAQVENVNAVILGEGSERSNLEQLAIDLGIQNRVQLLGWVDNPRSYLSQFDIVAMPSRSEGFPLAMVEAMLAARPVIATRVGSMPEAVIDGVTGWLIEKNDVDGLVKALKRSRDDIDLRLQIGQQARQIALANFTVEAMTKQYEQLWQELREKPRSPRFQVPRPKD
ncbi:glycosyltransferase [Leptolyngbya sp. NIES-2104]|uniref:glycosyltransferase n=1 Tax=Leptolyngbya sp. NIES-2104 TaxID=1552121 RepID=UPI0006ECA96E|nr:glycosyltransferase [Leptolyngbya sp. NIES-2104]GAP94732.1 glycosyltransferase [Leptolyngbya sp. NIES-2104]